MHFSLLATQIAAATLIGGSIAGAAALPELSAEQILERIAAAEASRSREVSGFSAVRHYQLSNHRGDKTATLDARMVYHLDSAKSFEVIGEGGNDSLFRRVIYRVLEGEAE